MKNKSHLALFHTFFILCTAAWASPSHTDFHPINVHGEMKDNACLPQKKQSILATLPEDARDLVDTLLCAEKTEASKTYLLRHMRKFIKSKEVDENYVERTKSIKADGELAERLLSAGEAWDVSLDITADRISITYMPNEACLSGRELVRKKGRWWITETDDACD
ncbi:hypothetical protein [Herbaspirillum rubrisubalbicans]|nr:hypothetical protein [Herbaspirillum rubrisubalbicans]